MGFLDHWSLARIPGTPKPLKVAFYVEAKQVEWSLYFSVLIPARESIRYPVRHSWTDDCVVRFDKIYENLRFCLMSLRGWGPGRRFGDL